MGEKAPNLYILNASLEMIGIVDGYKSLIWASRYYDFGDCEIYLPATVEAIALFDAGQYIARTDDPMVCRIVRIELDTDADEGDYLIITGKDVRGYLDQRVVWWTLTCKGRLETFARKMVRVSCINASSAKRNFLKPNGEKLIKLGPLTGFTDAAEKQVSYKNLGEEIREICKLHGWGTKLYLDGGQLAFVVYAGTDRSGSVIFSNDFENLSSTKYVEDMTNLGNVFLVAGEGEGAGRERAVTGDAEGVDRYEVYADARDLSKEITWAELTETYPLASDGGSGYIYQSHYYAETIDIMISSDWHLAWLQDRYPSGSVVTVDGVRYYRLTDVVIADLPSADPGDDDLVTLRDLVYLPYLIQRGEMASAGYGKVTTFEGSVIPDVTFVYGEDYFLGDIVLIRNEYGIEQPVRITEMLEVVDENGRRLEPTFENVER